MDMRVYSEQAWRLADAAVAVRERLDASPAAGTDGRPARTPPATKDPGASAANGPTRRDLEESAHFLGHWAAGVLGAGGQQQPAGSPGHRKLTEEFEKLARVLSGRAGVDLDRPPAPGASGTSPADRNSTAALHLMRGAD